MHTAARRTVPATAAPTTNSIGTSSELPVVGITVGVDKDMEEEEGGVVLGGIDSGMEEEEEGRIAGVDVGDRVCGSEVKRES